MPDLNDYRAEIDRIDAQISQLYEQRMSVVEGVTAYKRAHGMPVLQPSREAQVLDKAAARVQNPRYVPGARRLFETLMAVSRQAQHAELDAPASDVSALPARQTEVPRAVYPGCEGSFSEQALLNYFEGRCHAQAVARFEDAARAVRDGEADCALLPIENSTAGSVNETYDLLLKYDLYITGEQQERITHSLLGVPGAHIEHIRQVQSHPQAIAQCHDFLAAHPDWCVYPSGNTALSARAVARAGDRTQAAIASVRAAKLYGLEVLAQGIESENRNYTRFVVVSRRPWEGAGDKASLFFTLENRPGALCSVLEDFAQYGLNMCKLESRPVPGEPWTYAFYADFDWDGDARPLTAALEAAVHHTSNRRLLGCYRRAERCKDTL